MYRWVGYAVFSTVVVRDAKYAKLKDFLDATLEVVETDDPGGTQAGLAIQNNRVGDTVTGPAFTWSLSLPDAYVNDPPEGNGYCGSFITECETAGGEAADGVVGPF
jgi:hypothetical protein